MSERKQSTLPVSSCSCKSSCRSPISSLFTSQSFFPSGSVSSVSPLCRGWPGKNYTEHIFLTDIATPSETWGNLLPLSPTDIQRGSNYVHMTRCHQLLVTVSSYMSQSDDYSGVDRNVKRDRSASVFHDRPKTLISTKTVILVMSQWHKSLLVWSMTYCKVLTNLMVLLLRKSTLKIEQMLNIILAPLT